MCDIWRIRNLLEKSFIFCQNQSSGILNHRLDYIFISNKLHNFSNKAIILPAFKIDHSPVSVIISNYNEIKPGPGLWKFNNSQISDENFTEKLKNFIENLKVDLESILLMTKWNRSIWSSTSKNSQYHIPKYVQKIKEKKDLEKKLKDLKTDLNNYNKFQKFNKLNPNLKKLWKIYIWYEEREKFTKFFLNLEKSVLQVQIQKFIFENQEIMG